MNKHLSIKFWAKDDQPREKLVNKGKTALSDSELIAILLGSGNKNESAVELAKRMLADTSNNLSQLAKLTVNDLLKYEGIGEAKAITIIAALELGYRRRESEVMKKTQIVCSNDIYQLILPDMCDLKHEEFRAILLNRANKILKIEKISTGGTTGTVVDIKILLKSAIENLANGFVICHNHPSGNIKPSNEDITLTKKIKESSIVMDIQLLDHLIITEGGYYSFADEGLL